MQEQLRELKFDPHTLAHEELMHVYRDRHSALQVTLLSGAITALILGWGINMPAALGWFLWLVAAYAWHWFIGRPGPGAQGNIVRHLAAATIAGVGWGGAALALPWLGQNAQAALLVMMVIAVNTALPRLVVYLPIFLCFTAGVFVPLVLVLPFLGGSARELVGLVLIVAVATLLLSARHMRAVLVRILRKQIFSEHASSEDRLTGLGNRRRFDESLETAWQQAGRLGVPISLIILDVDHFKKFNDRYGHPAGDECLRQVANMLARCIKRGGDSVSRYGGEEFAVVLFHTPMTNARNIAEQMCRAVRELEILHDQSSYGVVTISLGGATMVPKPGSSERDIIDQADAALYRAKETGRNRVQWNLVA